MCGCSGDRLRLSKIPQLIRIDIDSLALHHTALGDKTIALTPKLFLIFCFRVKRLQFILSLLVLSKGRPKLKIDNDTRVIHKTFLCENSRSAAEVPTVGNVFRDVTSPAVIYH